MYITRLWRGAVWLLAALLAPLVAVWRWCRRRAHLVRLGAKFHGPLAFPIVGCVLVSWKLDPASIFKAAAEIMWKYCPVYRYYIGPYLIITSWHGEDLELILSGNKYVNKSPLYSKFLEPWLGDGLLISTGEKWHSRRKLLTPAFHFRILEQFAPVFHGCSDEFVRQLRKRAGGASFDLWPLVKLLTLDVICETAMGVKVNAQLDSTSEYVRVVDEVSGITADRLLQPWYHPNFIFYMSPLGRRYKKCLKVLHGETEKVIRERREELIRDCPTFGDSTFDIDELGRRRRVAFLDLLLLQAQKGQLSDADIREEVDTFMFEGHDTTASAISFTIYLLSQHEDVQEKLLEELKTVFDWPQPFQPSLQQLSELKYLEMVIKESLRIYPPVTLTFRGITEDEKLPAAGLVMPAGCHMEVAAHSIHRHAAVFPDPERFDPERFSPEQSARRHPFAYLPFSAGPRNCIGQRFAMLELKSILAKVVWNFRIKPESGFEVALGWRLILRSMNGIRIRLEDRH